MLPQTERKLIKWLYREGGVPREKLESAMEQKALRGGSICLNLIEAGSADEPTLCRALAAVTSYKTINPIRFDDIPKHSGRLLERKLAEKHHVVPISQKGKTLNVVIGDPDEVRSLDEVAFATGLKLNPIIAIDTRIEQLLYRIYDVMPSVRTGTLFGRLVSKPSQTQDMAVEAAIAKPTGPKTVVTDSGIEIGHGDGDLIGEDDFNDMYAGDFLGDGSADTEVSAEVLEELASVEEIEVEAVAEVEAEMEASVTVETEAVEPTAATAPPSVIEPPAVAPEPEPEPEPAVELPKILTAQEATVALDNAKNRQELSEILLGFARSHYTRAVLFTLGDQELLGWDGLGDGITQAQLDQMWLPLNAQSVFQMAATTSAHHLGPVPVSNPIHRRFFSLLGGGVPNSGFVMPLRYLHKVTHMLYFDNGPGQDVNPMGVGDVLIVATRIPGALGALVKAARAEIGSDDLFDKD